MSDPHQWAGVHTQMTAINSGTLCVTWSLLLPRHLLLVFCALNGDVALNINFVRADRANPPIPRPVPVKTSLDGAVRAVDVAKCVPPVRLHGAPGEELQDSAIYRRSQARQLSSSSSEPFRRRFRPDHDLTWPWAAQEDDRTPDNAWGALQSLSVTSQARKQMSTIISVRRKLVARITRETMLVQARQRRAKICEDPTMWAWMWGSRLDNAPSCDIPSA
ncbi:hypothetical protein BV22DRAFT_1047305 [Leucogyrophana mollusca]|uniref:Uncharacterized protein n=1 Tax=Leucogyrophana mollusca TaxID=85980 RepID=A0ACB8BFT1_9AGAM|nr:hypothetical protein BV22DRAFT_1047305 [Leucogyrophana mollusca]